MDQTNDRAAERPTAEQRSRRRVREMELAGVLSRDDEPQQAMREMTPDEIRLDEVQAIGERIGLIPRGAPDYMQQVSRIIEGRAAHLKPAELLAEDAELVDRVFGEPEMVSVPKFAAEAAGLAYTTVGPDNKTRADELANLLDFIEGDPIDGSPNQIEVINGVRTRIAELLGQDRPDPLPSEQPWSDAVARLSGAIRSEARDLSWDHRMNFLTELVNELTRIVSEETTEVPEATEAGESIVGAEAIISHLVGHLSDGARKQRAADVGMALLAGNSDDIVPEVRSALATKIAALVIDNV